MSESEHNPEAHALRNKALGCLVYAVIGIGGAFFWRETAHDLEILNGGTVIALQETGPRDNHTRGLYGREIDLSPLPLVYMKLHFKDALLMGYVRRVQSM